MSQRESTQAAVTRGFVMIDARGQSAHGRHRASNRAGAQPPPAMTAALSWPRSSRGYAKYIGRVGALAVALGIGTAVATSPGLAWATDGDPSTTSTGDADATNTTGTTNTSTDSSL